MKNKSLLVFVATLILLVTSLAASVLACDMGVNCNLAYVEFYGQAIQKQIYPRTETRSHKEHIQNYSPYVLNTTVTVKTIKGNGFGISIPYLNIKQYTEDINEDTIAITLDAWQQVDYYTVENLYQSISDINQVYVYYCYTHREENHVVQNTWYNVLYTDYSSYDEPIYSYIF